MQEFIAKHKEEIAGVLSGFDRLIFRGDAAVKSADGIWQACAGGGHALKVSVSSKGRAPSQADEASSKEEVARGIAAREKIEEGLVCAQLCRVSVLDTGVYERAGVAGAADGASVGAAG
jgi:hypothetical protein